jgi:hypothetical protein
MSPQDLPVQVEAPVIRFGRIRFKAREELRSAGGSDQKRPISAGSLDAPTSRFRFLALF